MTGDGMTRECAVNLDHAKTVPHVLLIGALSKQDVEIDDRTKEEFLRGLLE